MLVVEKSWGKLVLSLFTLNIVESWIFHCYQQVLTDFMPGWTPSSVFTRLRSSMNSPNNKCVPLFSAAYLTWWIIDCIDRVWWNPSQSERLVELPPVSVKLKEVFYYHCLGFINKQVKQGMWYFFLLSQDTSDWSNCKYIYMWTLQGRCAA